MLHMSVSYFFQKLTDMAIEQETFHWLDYVIFSIILISSCAIGIYYAVTDSKRQTQEEFLMGNRKLKWLPVGISILVSYNSAISMLGKPAETYLYGVQFFTGIIGISLAVFISVLTFVPFMFNMKLTSTFEVCKLNKNAFIALQYVHSVSDYISKTS